MPASHAYPPYIEGIIFDATGKPAAGGTVEAYVAGSSVPTPLWSTSDPATSLGPVVTIDGAGRAAFRLREGYAYKLRAKDADGALIWERDNVKCPLDGGIENPMTSIGDLIVGGVDGTPERLSTEGASRGFALKLVENGDGELVQSWEKDDFVPLSGTAQGEPITGDLEQTKNNHLVIYTSEGISFSGLNGASPAFSITCPTNYCEFLVDTPHGMLRLKYNGCGIWTKSVYDPIYLSSQSGINISANTKISVKSENGSVELKSADGSYTHIVGLFSLNDASDADRRVNAILANGDIAGVISSSTASHSLLTADAVQKLIERNGFIPLAGTAGDKPITGRLVSTSDLFIQYPGDGNRRTFINSDYISVGDSTEIISIWGNNNGAARISANAMLIINSTGTLQLSSNDEIDISATNGVLFDNKYITGIFSSSSTGLKTDNDLITAKAAEDVAKAQNPMDGAGQMIVGGTGGVPQKLAVGTAGQVLTSNGTTANWSNLPRRINWSIPPSFINGTFNQTVDRTFYVEIFPETAFSSVDAVVAVLRDSNANDEWRVAVFDNARNMIYYGESTGSATNFRKVTLTKLGNFTFDADNVFFLAISQHSAGSANSSIATTSAITAPFYCWYEDNPLTSGRAMPPNASLTASSGKVPAIGLRGV